MTNGFLSQEEIDSLLNGDTSSNEPSTVDDDVITDIDKDLLGEIGNISMGSASTALSQIINQPVNITTPIVTAISIGELKKQFHVPNILLEVQYTSGIVGKNILVMKIPDAAVIANLMMGGDGKVDSKELSEIEISAVQEAMNQMIGSAATSMATMFAREVNISPPNSQTWSDESQPLSNNLGDSEKIICVSFTLTIGDLVDSNIMQILPINTAKTIVSIMMAEEVKGPNDEISSNVQETLKPSSSTIKVNKEPNFEDSTLKQKPIEEYKKPVEVSEAAFENLTPGMSGSSYKNIDLIMDVPLDISVVLGRTKKSIKDVLSLGNGSLIELDKLADEPVEILVNGKRIAEGEVVVVDENFGVRITSIVSGTERIKSLK